MTDEDVLKPIDLIGDKSSNLIVDELHNLDELHSTFIVPKWGAFYKGSLIVYDVVNGAQVSDSKYDLMDLHLDATLKSGKSVFEFIRITDESVGKILKITYQALGGIGNHHRENLIDWLHTRQVNAGSQDWNDLIDKPKKYHPAYHLHLLSHVYGMEYITNELTRIKDAILAGNDKTYQGLLDMLDRKFQLALTQVNEAITRILTERFNAFKDSVNGAGIGLSNIINAGLLSRPAAKGIADPGYDSSLSNVIPKEYVSLNSLDAFKDQALNYIVPVHYTRLGLFKNDYIRPTKAGFLELLDGGLGLLPSKQVITDNNVEYDFHVYPKGVSATDEFFVERVVTNESNSGGVFILYNALNYDTYIGMLINDSCHEKVNWNRLFTDGELDTFIKTVNDHFVDNKNPHEVNKTHVSLNNIENLAVVSEDEIINKKSARKYVTLDTLMYFMKAFLTNAKPPPKPGDPVDPNARLMDQCQIIFSQCKKEPLPPEVFPGKGQLINTFCDGFDKFARYTDGKGSFYDELMQKDDIDCGYKEYPKAGTTLNTFCDGTDKKAKVADGVGGNYDIVITHKSAECGYKDPMTLGTVISVFCSGKDKMTRYADGEGGSYDMITFVNSPECGYEAPAAPGPSGSPPSGGTPTPTSPTPAPTPPAPTGADYSGAGLTGSIFSVDPIVIPPGMSGQVTGYALSNSTFTIDLYGNGFPKNISTNGVLRIRRGSSSAGSTVNRTYNLSGISSNDLGKINKTISMSITPSDISNGLTEYLEIVLSFNYAAKFYEVKTFLLKNGTLYNSINWYVEAAPTPPPPPDYSRAWVNRSVVSTVPTFNDSSVMKIDAPQVLKFSGSNFPPEISINFQLEIFRGDTVSTSTLNRVVPLGAYTSNIAGSVAEVTINGDATPPDVTPHLIEYIYVRGKFNYGGQAITSQTTSIMIRWEP